MKKIVEELIKELVKECRSGPIIKKVIENSEKGNLQIKIKNLIQKNIADFAF